MKLLFIDVTENTRVVNYKVFFPVFQHFFISRYKLLKTKNKTLKFHIEQLATEFSTFM